MPVKKSPFATTTATIISVLLVFVLVAVISIVVSNAGKKHSPDNFITGIPTFPGTTTTSENLAVASCMADAKTVETAYFAYNATNTKSLGTESGITVGVPSTYAQGTDAKLLLKQDFLSAWPTSPYFAISLSTTSAGDVTIYSPPSSTVGTSYNYETSTTGCNSVS
jgi:hypothetical protein